MSSSSLLYNCRIFWGVCPALQLQNINGCTVCNWNRHAKNIKRQYHTSIKYIYVGQVLRRLRTISFLSELMTTQTKLALQFILPYWSYPSGCDTIKKGNPLAIFTADIYELHKNRWIETRDGDSSLRRTRRDFKTWLGLVLKRLQTQLWLVFLDSWTIIMFAF